MTQPTRGLRSLSGGQCPLYTTERLLVLKCFLDGNLSKRFYAHSISRE